jgi:hypothetical protein
MMDVKLENNFWNVWPIEGETHVGMPRGASGLGPTIGRAL